MPRQLAKAAGLGSAIKKSYKGLHRFFFGTGSEPMRMRALKKGMKFKSKAEEDAARALLKKYRRRQAVAALGLTGAAGSPLVYRALKKPDATR